MIFTRVAEKVLVKRFTCFGGCFTWNGFFHAPIVRDVLSGREASRGEEDANGLHLCNIRSGRVSLEGGVND